MNGGDSWTTSTGGAATTATCMVDYVSTPHLVTSQCPDFPSPSSVSSPVNSQYSTGFEFGTAGHPPSSALPPTASGLDDPAYMAYSYSTTVHPTRSTMSMPTPLGGALLLTPTASHNISHDLGQFAQYSGSPDLKPKKYVAIPQASTVNQAASPASPPSSYYYMHLDRDMASRRTSHLDAMTNSHQPDSDRSKTGGFVERPRKVTEKRREQNRAAQKAMRERRKSAAQEQSRLLENTLTENATLKNHIMVLMKENERLINVVQQREFDLGEHSITFSQQSALHHVLMGRQASSISSPRSDHRRISLVPNLHSADASMYHYPQLQHGLYGDVSMPSSLTTTPPLPPSTSTSSVASLDTTTMVSGLCDQEFQQTALSDRPLAAGTSASMSSSSSSSSTLTASSS